MTYRPELDALRALAILLVAGFHAKVPGLRGGFLGVDLFFVLSGYLITRLLSEEYAATGGLRLGRFYVRRLCRLYPALLALVATCLALSAFSPRSLGEQWRDAAVVTLYLSDYGRAFWRVPEFLSHTWSLAVEEHFYLVWPLLLLAVLKLPMRWRIAALLAGAGAATWWRWHELFATFDWLQVYYRFDTRLSGLFLGGALAMWNPRLGRHWAGIAILAFALALSMSHWRNPKALTSAMLIAELASALLICSTSSFRGVQALAWLGRMSYGFYLWHYPIMKLVREYHGWPIVFIAGCVGGLAMAALSYYTIERAFRRSRATTPVPAS